MIFTFKFSKSAAVMAVFATILFSGLAIPSVALAYMDPGISWRVLRTPHFEVIYDSQKKALAQTYAVAAEQAYQTLQPIFKEMPSKTYVVLSDQTDLSNGAATFLPYPMIIVYPVLPDTLDSLDFYGNWPLEMMMHEYTHILNFQPAHGFYTPLKYLFGSLMAPNGLLPRWYQEGLAVEMESHNTTHGRLKAPRTSALIRGLAQDDRLKTETVSRINETSIPEYPYGERPYFYGSLLWSQMVQKKGDGIIYNLNQDYGRRLPFLIDEPVEDRLGVDYASLLSQMSDGLETKATTELQTVKDAGGPVQTRVTAARSESEELAPSISPDGKKLVYVTSIFDESEVPLAHRQSLRWLHRDDPQKSFIGTTSEGLLPVRDTLKISWFPDSQSFAYDDIDIRAHYTTYRTLFIYSFKNRSARAIDRSIRGQEPAVSPDGNTIAYVANDGGRTSLRLYDLKTEKTRLLLAPGLNERISRPEFISANEIALTAKDHKGREHFIVYNVATHKHRSAFKEYPDIHHPRMTAKGLLFLSARTGAQNVYLAAGTDGAFNGAAHAVTNTPTRISSAVYDSSANQLIVSQLTGQGRKLFAEDLEPTHPPRLDPLVGQTWPSVRTPSVDGKTFEDQSYQPLWYMWPRYWMPFVYQVENGAYIQGTTTGQDPVGINSYTLSGAYDTSSRKGSYGVSYENASLPVRIGVDYAKAQEYLGASDLTLENEITDGVLRFYLPGLSRRWKMGLGYENLRSEEISGGFLQRQGPIGEFTYSSFNDPTENGTGTQIELRHEQFLAQADHLAYGHSVAAITQGWKLGFLRRHWLVTRAKVSLAPDLPFGRIIEVGDRSLGANYLVNLSGGDFLFRGYPSGTFVGRKLVNWNVDYEFPIWERYQGFGTFPLFVRNLTGTIFVDGLGADGASYNPDRGGYFRRRLSEIAMSTGAEFKLNTTVAYHLPVTFILGLYEGLDDKAGHNFTTFFGLGFEDFKGINGLNR